jgi:hypothetical protein
MQGEKFEKRRLTLRRGFGGRREVGGGSVGRGLSGSLRRLNARHDMIFIARVLLWIFALVAVLLATGTASVCGYVYGSTLFRHPRISPSDLALVCASVSVYFGLVKSFIAGWLAAGAFYKGGATRAVLIWIVLFVYDCCVVGIVILVYVPAPVSPYGHAFLAATYLTLDVVSGSLVWVAVWTRSALREAPPSRQPAIAAVPPATTAPAGTVPPPQTFETVQAFILHFQSHKASKFAGVRLEADGSITTTQRALMSVLGRSLGGVNALLREEREAGRIVAISDSRGTRLSLPVQVEAASMITDPSLLPDLGSYCPTPLFK